MTGEDDQPPVQPVRGGDGDPATPPAIDDPWSGPRTAAANATASTPVVGWELLAAIDRRAIGTPTSRGSEAPRDHPWPTDTRHPAEAAPHWPALDLDPPSGGIPGTWWPSLPSRADAAETSETGATSLHLAEIRRRERIDREQRGIAWKG